MKKLAKDRMMRLAYVLLTLTFLISNIFSLISKNKAQSNFAKNSLSFLMLKENDADFLKELEKFNTSHAGIDLAYFDEDNKLIYSTSDLSFKNLKSKDLSKINEGEISKKVYLKSLLNIRNYYTVKNTNYLSILVPTSLSHYIDLWLLISHLLLALIASIVIDKLVEDGVDQYVSHLDYATSKENLSSPIYDDIRPALNSYMAKVDNLKDESLRLANRLSEFINITSNMKEGIILFDGSGNIELMNDAAKLYLGVANDAKLSNLIDSKEYAIALREASILRRSKVLDIKLNGYNLRIFIDPLSSSLKKAFAMIIIDNTEEKRAEQMRREFSANVTHELKSPLTSINGYAELIATGIAKEDDVAKFGEIIYKEGNRLLEIIDDILKISRLDEQNYEKDTSSVDIKEVVSQTIEKFDRITASKEISVTNNIKPYRINTTKSLFTDLVSNIYENAIKYNKEGGSITIDYEMGENTYYLIIADTGIGIAQADINRIFERFYVVDKSRKRNQKSTGLGLSIVKHIISYLNYDIKVESELGKGTKFIIEIPLQLDREI